MGWEAPSAPSPSSESVCVAVHVRPLIELELDQGCAECLSVTPGVQQVGSGPHRFAYDHVFGGDCGQEPEQLYSRCVAPLVDGLFKGYNATVFAYGQTGSGKTFTMGSAFPQDPAALHPGVIPRVMADVFTRVAEAPAGVDFTVRVGFVEINKEGIRDLLAARQQQGSGGSVHIRELPSGGIVLAGATEREVHSREEMTRALEEGTALRATAETGMNKTSSRSHAIFTITLEQRRLPRPRSAPQLRRGGGDSEGDDAGSDSEEEEDDLDSYLCAKMHLVDLAGSERVKRTKAQGQRLAEGININKGLLALGNVINALSEGKGHVPYRDSKLTRMLQDSLGGNSRTTMIACVSPADVNLEESLNTLRYAARARAIRNTPVVNRDPVAAQIAVLRQQLAAARAENLELRRRLGLTAADELAELAEGGAGGALAEALAAAEGRVQAVQQDNALLTAEVAEMEAELKGAWERLLTAQLQRDRVAQALGGAAGQGAVAEVLAATGLTPERGTTEQEQAERLRELEAEISRLKRLASTPGSVREDSGVGLDPGDEEFLAQELAHRAEMARMRAEHEQLQLQLESKEAAMAAVAGHVSARHSYEAQLKELASERDTLARERSDLLAKLRSLQSTSAEERARMERAFKERIRDLDARVKAADVKERKIRELEAARARAVDAVRALERDIHGIKAQKVALQRRADQSAKEFGAWKRQRDTEVNQLRRQGRANASQLQRMEALHAKQQDVLRRKTEEAAAARKRLKQLEDRRGRGRGGSRRPGSAQSTPSSSKGAPPAVAAGAATSDGADLLEALAELPVQPNAAAPYLRGEGERREWVEAELDACCSSYEVQRVLEGEKALRSEAARQLRAVEWHLASMKNPQWWGGAGRGAATAAEGGKGQLTEEALVRKRGRLAAAVERHGRQIQEVALQLVKARASEEERGGGAADAKRWAALPAPPQARALLTTIFRSASQYKAAAYEASLAVTELSEEVEMLRLKLEVAAAEKLEAARATADARAAAVAAEAASQAAPAQADASCQETAEECAEEGSDLEEESEEEESEEEEIEEEEESDDEETEDEADAWDPSKATPLVGGRAQRRAPASGGSSGASAPVSPGESLALNHFNSERRRNGEPELGRLTVPALRAALKGRVVGGQEWRAGNKKRRELVRDYQALVAEEAIVVQPSASAVSDALSSAGPCGGASAAAPAATPLAAQGPTPESSSDQQQPSSSGTGERLSPFGQIKAALQRQRSNASTGSTGTKSSPLRLLAGRMLGAGRAPTPPQSPAAAGVPAAAATHCASPLGLPAAAAEPAHGVAYVLSKAGALASSAKESFDPGAMPEEDGWKPAASFFTSSNAANIDASSRGGGGVDKGDLAGAIRRLVMDGEGPTSSASSGPASSGNSKGSGAGGPSQGSKRRAWVPS